LGEVTSKLAAAMGGAASDLIRASLYTDAAGNVTFGVAVATSVNVD
jgi:hypothetical protein